MDPGRISSMEAALLLLATALPWAILFMPRMAVEIAGRDAWLAAVPLTLFALVLGYLAASLQRRYPGQTLVSMICRVVGRPLGLAVGVAYAAWFVSVAALTLREAGEVIINVILPRTPIPVVLGSLLLVAALNVRSGIEVMARSNLFLAPFVIGFLLVLVIFSLRDIRATSLLPVLEQGAVPMLRGAYVSAGFSATAVAALATAGPRLNRPQEIFGVVTWAVCVVGGLTLVSSVWFVGVMGAELAGRMRFLPVEAARFISVAEFLERMEALTVAFWVMATFAKLSVWYYAAVTSLSEVLGLGDYRPMVWPMGLLIGEGSLLFFRNISDLTAFVRFAGTPYMLVFEMVIPMAVLVVAAVRRAMGTRRQRPAR